MARGTDTPIVVVGAGPVGLTAAVELARRDVPVRVVAAGTGPSTISKAIGTHARTLEALERCGVTDRLVALGLPIRRFRLHDQSRVLGELSLAEVPSAYPYALSLGQDVTERVLLDRLRETGVEVEWGTRLQSLHQDRGAREVQLTLDRRGNDTRESDLSDDREVTASWVIGCDGASSTVRRRAGIDFEGESFPEWFLVADLLIDGDLGEERANLYLSGAGATAVFPLPEPGAFRLATPLPGGDPDDEAPDNARVVELDDIRGLWATRVGRAARLSDPRWISPFRFQIRLAGQYRSGRVFLAGDAAHVHSPVGGQGMNTGIQDAVNLAWKLVAVRRGAPEALLDTYQAERRPVAARVLHETRRQAVMASSNSPTVRVGRTVGLRLVTRTAPLRRRVLSELTMLSVSYPPTALPGSPPGPSVRERITGAPAVGERAPDAPVVSDGQPGRLSDLLAPRWHTLLCFDSGQSAEDDGLAGLTRADLGSEGDVTVIVVRRHRAPLPVGGEGAERAVELHDPDGRAHHAYGAGRPLAVLVRPDGVIAWRGAVTSADRTRLRAVLDAMLPPGVS